eukprot:CAMPEP_0113606312 /NCGR_PEP_ID=MMETSP0017_2-20120614/2787_1 /TAXON_ID=2856 /ORGANISM="Cylindrotheca closterium" /LENGTH=284 /DNA_ID=CAMNT_0000514847 /DNA_START=36 /DNA_END=893 /DNA_ORIENTATION=+ /assembly_acc=CAM_ASM_000147
MPEHLAAKFRCHKGTHIECVYSMRSFGIPPSALPIPDTGANKPPLMYQHTIWYQNREKIDREKDRMLGMKQQHGMWRQQEQTAIANIIPNDDDEFSFGDPLAEELGDPFMDDLGDSFMEEKNDNQMQPLQETQARLQAVPQAAPQAPPQAALLPVVPLVSQSQIHGNALLNMANTIITPRRTDVLFGPKYMYHPGTLHLQELISQQLPVFESILHRTDKTKFVGMLVQHLKASGTRFLAMDKGTNQWIEVDDNVARNKIAKTFRNKRRTTGVGPSFLNQMDAPN